MINRENYTDVKQYLDYIKEVRQTDDKSVKRVWGFLRHLLEWADSCPFPKVEKRKPSFPAYLVTARNDGLQKPLAPSTMKKTCEYARDFFEHMKGVHSDRYRSLPAAWIESVRPSRANGIQSVLQVHEYYPIEDVLKIAKTPVGTLRLERDRAAACFLFLSGMRADAFVSMPISRVDLAIGKITQVPTTGGMRTKNSKAAVTSLLSIPELTEIVRAWDAKVRAALPENSTWYAPINHDGDGFLLSVRNSEGRRVLLERGFMALCELAGVPYHSPHKFRHGHAVYSLKQAKDVSDLKAISQNLMHSNVGITDGIYARLVEDDVHNLVSSLGTNRENKPVKPEGNTAEKAALLKKLDEKPEMLALLTQLLGS